MDLNTYLALFPGASRNKPRFMALASAVLRQTTDLIPLTASLLSGFSFASAQGGQLDEIAGAVGLRRQDAASSTDAGFRAYLLAKLALWGWDGTNAGVPAVLSGLPGTVQTDNGDGTVTVSASSLPGPAAELFPVPAGVRVIS